MAIFKIRCLENIPLEKFYEKNEYHSSTSQNISMFQQFQGNIMLLLNYYTLK